MLLLSILNADLVVLSDLTVPAFMQSQRNVLCCSVHITECIELAL